MGLRKGLILILSLALISPLIDTASAQTGQQSGAVIRVLNLIYDPVLEFKGGVKLRENQHWNDPIPFTNLYNDEVMDRSGGFVQIEMVDTIVLDAYPPQRNGYVYTDENMYHRVRNGGYLNLLGLPEDRPNDKEPLGKAAAGTQHAQSFKSIGTALQKLKVGISKVGTPSTAITVSLRQSLTGPNLRTRTIQPSEIQSRDSSSPSWIERDLADNGIYPDVVFGAVYYIVLTVPSANSNNYYQISLRTPSCYADGQMYLGTSRTVSPGDDMALQLEFDHGTDYVKVLNATPFTVQGVTKTIAEHVRDGRIDEVYLWGGPWFGYWESAMAGPGAFFINGGTYPEVNSGKAFVIMGFNYATGVENMLEDLAHRTEATMSHIYGGWQVENLNHNWARFAANSWQSGGQAGCGTAHYPPNAVKGYDFSNSRTVSSYCDTFYNYPSIDMARTRTVSNLTWRNTFPRTQFGSQCDHWSYYAWWFEHLPKFQGINPVDRRLNNWWRYIYQPEFYKAGGEIQGPENRPPSVQAGADQAVALYERFNLNGQVSDDGLPSTAPLRLSWYKVTGPGTVDFGNPADPRTAVSFSAQGTYVLRLVANDGELATFDDVTISVTAPLVTQPRVGAMTAPAEGGTYLYKENIFTSSYSISTKTEHLKQMRLLISTQLAEENNQFNGTVVQENPGVFKAYLHDGYSRWPDTKDIPGKAWLGGCTLGLGQPLRDGRYIENQWVRWNVGESFVTVDSSSKTVRIYWDILFINSYGTQPSQKVFSYVLSRFGEDDRTSANHVAYGWHVGPNWSVWGPGMVVINPSFEFNPVGNPYVPSYWYASPGTPSNTRFELVSQPVTQGTRSLKVETAPSNSNYYQGIWQNTQSPGPGKSVVFSCDLYVVRGTVVVNVYTYNPFPTTVWLGNAVVTSNGGFHRVEVPIRTLTPEVYNRLHYRIDGIQPSNTSSTSLFYVDNVKLEVR